MGNFGNMGNKEKVFKYLEDLGIDYSFYEHPEAPTIEVAKEYWKPDGSRHCKNLFFRNHKGNKHYLVVFDADKNLAIRDLEQLLKQGKLTFASEKRMMRYLGVTPGSVSPFGLINDEDNHVHLFLDENLLKEESLSYHPNDNTATVVISQEGFQKFLNAVGNSYEYLRLY